MKKNLTLLFFCCVALFCFILCGSVNHTEAACSYTPASDACTGDDVTDRNACLQQLINKNCAASSTGSGSSDSATNIGSANSNASVVITNPVEYNTVEEFLSRVLTRARQIIVVLSLVFILIGAIMYITSAGSPGMIEQAKKAITASLIGLAIGIAAPSFLKEIGTILGWQGINNSDVSGALTLSAIAMNVLNFLLGILGVLAMVMLVIGGIMYLTSAGDEDRIDKGKKIFTYSIIGIIVAMSSLVVVKQIAKFFA